MLSLLAAGQSFNGAPTPNPRTAFTFLPFLLHACFAPSYSLLITCHGGLFVIVETNQGQEDACGALTTVWQ